MGHYIFQRRESSSKHIAGQIMTGYKWGWRTGIKSKMAKEGIQESTYNSHSWKSSPGENIFQISTESCMKISVYRNDYHYVSFHPKVKIYLVFPFLFPTTWILY